jgi:hypothetical protein
MNTQLFFFTVSTVSKSLLIVLGTSQKPAMIGRGKRRDLPAVPPIVAGYFFRFSANCTGHRFALVKAQVLDDLAEISICEMLNLVLLAYWRALTIPARCPGAGIESGKNVMFWCRMAKVFCTSNRGAGFPLRCSSPALRVPQPLAPRFH